MAGQELPELVAGGGLLPQVPAPLGLGLSLGQLCRERDGAGKLSPPPGRARPASGPHARLRDSRRSSRSRIVLGRGARGYGLPALSGAPALRPRPRPRAARAAEHPGECSPVARGILGTVV